MGIELTCSSAVARLLGLSFQEGVGVTEPPELLPLGDAAARLGISRSMMWRRAKEWRLTVYINPMDRRQKLFSWAEIEEARRPKKGAA
jgi:hypothetical protein